MDKRSENKVSGNEASSNGTISRNSINSDGAVLANPSSYHPLSVWERMGNSIGGFFKRLGNGFVNFFKSLWECFYKGDWATKLSFLIMGFGYFIHSEDRTKTYNHRFIIGKKLKEGYDPSDARVSKGFIIHRVDYNEPVTREIHVVQWLRGVFFLLIEVLEVLVIVFWGVPNFSKVTLTNIVTGKGGDNTFLILLYCVVSAVLTIAYLAILPKTIKGVYKSQVDIANGQDIKCTSEDLEDLVDNKFYITVLAVPVLGVVIFTIVPMLLMILIAFTNYDSSHTPPGSAFSWVGWTNFAAIFSGTTSAFGMVFLNQLVWTLEWAFLATFTCYFGGLLLALLLNSKRTRFRKFWRTCFVVTIAVPQFVSLMLIRYFLDKNGIVNNWLRTWQPYGEGQMSVVQWAQYIGWIKTDYFPFLEDPTWMKWVIIFVNMWVGFPYLMLIVSGILMNIPADLYESAQIDGAGKQRMFWCITMPYILQVTGPYLISSFVNNINNFNVIYLLTSGYTTSNIQYGSVSGKETDLLVTWLFNMITGSSNKYYMASVIGLFMFILTSIVTLLTFTQTTKGNREQRFQ